MLFSQYNNWENITNTNMVYSLYSDIDTLWVGTFGGLIKYNKKTGESICYTRANSGLPSNCITGLAKDSKNNLWVACQYNGIGSFKNRVCTSTYNIRNSNMFSDQYSEGIFVNKNDTVFFGPDGSINSLYNHELKWIPAGDWLESIPQFVKDIAQAPNGDLVLATSYGLYKYKDSVMTLLNNLTVQCNTVELNRTGDIWIGTAGEGIYKYSNGTFTRYDSSNSESPDGAGSIAFDKNNDMWMANGKGVFNFKESGGSKHYWSSIMGSNAFKITIDDNSIWIATLQTGLYRFDLNTKQFEKIDITDSKLQRNSNFPLYVLGDKLLLSNYGIQTYDGNVFKTVVDTSTGLKTSNKICVYNNKGIFTFGDKTTIGYYENGSWTYYEQFLNDYVKNLVPVSHDIFWLATNRGLLKYQKGDVIVYNTENSPLPNNYLYALAMDSKGVIWGSFGYINGEAGIFAFDGVTWRIWTKAQVPFLEYNATCFVFDSQDNLWCNSLNQSNMMNCKGLIRYDGNNWTLYDQSNSLLPSNTIYNIYADTNDTIWTACAGGAAKFDRKNTWKAYTVDNSGLAFSSVQAVVRIPNGNVYFGHNYGGLSLFKNGSIVNSVLKITSENVFKIYPIPMHDVLNISVLDDLDIRKIEIYDITGKLMYKRTLNLSDQKNKQYTLHISSFTKSIYFIHLTTNRGHYSKKFIII